MIVLTNQIQRKFINIALFRHRVSYSRWNLIRDLKIEIWHILPDR